MELLNATKMQAGYTMGVGSTGRESLVVAIKGTFSIPEHPSIMPVLMDEQLPLIMADTYTGEPGFSAPEYEVDYSPTKTACDVLLLGGAHSHRPVSQVQVGIKVGTMSKTFMVRGDRNWKAGATGIYAGPAKPFVYMPITYDRAFGGVDNFLEDEKHHKAYMPNPIGAGYHKHLDSHLVNNTAMPNTEEINRPVTDPDDAYRPMSFGPIGRSWEPRYHHAGTYDEEWMDNQFPFLPKDFDNRYFQSAPLDQQIPFPKGGEEVILINLCTGEPRVEFKLPVIDIPVVFFRKKGEKHETQAVIDTIIFEPNNGLFTVTWRANLPLKKNIFEIPQILVGNMSKGWWRARELGKTWYPSLAHLEKSKREAAEEEV